MSEFDLVIVGGGPAGSMTALKAAEQGYAVLMVERDNTIGSPVRCAEAVDRKGLIEFFEPDASWVSSTIKGYALVAPDDTMVEINSGDCEGYILERLIFDRMIAENAAGAGAVVMTGTEAVGLSEYQGGRRTITLRNDEREWTVKVRIVIAADGVESRVARWAGLKTHAALHDMETCAQYVLAGIPFDPHRFHMYFTREFAPGGYAWVFPKGPRTANVGLGISGDNTAETCPRRYLDAFIARHFPGGSVVSKTYGGITCSGGISCMVADGLMVAGDAAHMANPFTGGGIVNAMIAGSLAVQTADEAMKRGTTERSALAPYEKRFNKRIGKENRLFYKIKEGIMDIPDEQFNRIAHEIVRLPIEKRTPVRVLQSALLKQPKLLLLLAKVIL